jgi:uncharacterized membrane protein
VDHTLLCTCVCFPCRHLCIFVWCEERKGGIVFLPLDRGLWLIFLELFVLSLLKSFNPTYPYFTLQVIWAIGVCMIALSSIIYLKPQWILLTGILLVALSQLT